MTVHEMRREISEVYPGEGWKNKVSKMPEDQVMAVYFNFLEKGRFSKVDKKQQQEENNKASVKATGALFTPYVGTQLKFDI